MFEVVVLIGTYAAGWLSHAYGWPYIKAKLFGTGL